MSFPVLTQPARHDVETSERRAPDDRNRDTPVRLHDFPSDQRFFVEWEVPEE